MSKLKKKKQHTLLKGEGANQHTLYGAFKLDETKTEFSQVVVTEDSVLKHEQPDGTFGEHNALKIEQGNWVTGKQVEYNPFQRTISQIWD